MAGPRSAREVCRARRPGRPFAVAHPAPGRLRRARPGLAYDAVRVPSGGLGALLRASTRVTGLSLTMPLKRAALGLADPLTDRAPLIGAANTLVLDDDEVRADNTDLPWARPPSGSVRTAPLTAVRILGADATTASVGLGLCDAAHQVGFWSALSSAPPRPRRRSRWTVRVLPCGVDSLRRPCRDLRAPTLPAVAQSPTWWRRGPGSPSSSRSSTTVADPAGGSGPGGRVLVAGLDLSWRQASLQFALFTGSPASLAAMRAAAGPPGSALARGRWAAGSTSAPPRSCARCGAGTSGAAAGSRGCPEPAPRAPTIRRRAGRGAEGAVPRHRRPLRAWQTRCGFLAAAVSAAVSLGRGRWSVWCTGPGADALAVVDWRTRLFRSRAAPPPWSGAAVILAVMAERSAAGDADGRPGPGDDRPAGGHALLPTVVLLPPVWASATSGWPPCSVSRWATWLGRARRRRVRRVPAALSGRRRSVGTRRAPGVSFGPFMLAGALPGVLGGRCVSPSRDAVTPSSGGSQ